MEPVVFVFFVGGAIALTALLTKQLKDRRDMELPPPPAWKANGGMRQDAWADFDVNPNSWEEASQDEGGPHGY